MLPQIYSDICPKITPIIIQPNYKDAESGINNMCSFN